jgi:hypothetical protein
MTTKTRENMQRRIKKGKRHHGQNKNQTQKKKQSKRNITWTTPKTRKNIQKSVGKEKRHQRPKRNLTQKEKLSYRHTTRTGTTTRKNVQALMKHAKKTNLNTTTTRSCRHTQESWPSTNHLKEVETS